MAFELIDWNKIKVGDPLTKDILSKVKNSLDNLHSRVTGIETSSVNIQVLNGDVSFYGYSSTESDIFYYKSPQDMSLNDFRVQIFSKQNITTGTLTLRLEKSSGSTEDSTFATVLTTDLVFDFASDADYVMKVASLDSTKNSLLVNNVLRLRVISIPSGFTGKILVYIGGK